MILSFYHIALAICIAFGTYWCIIVIGRVREDFHELRETREWTQYVATIFIWLVTLVIAVLLIRFAVGMVMKIVDAFR